MNEATPFVKRKVACPMCTKEAAQYSLPPNQYSVEEQESDQHPLKLKWYDVTYQNIKPHHYVLFHCPYCFFTDFEENYCNQQTIPNFISLQKGFYERNPLKEKLLKFMHYKINYDKMPFESAFCLHLSAIFIYEIEQNEKYKDSKKLSRLYHRLGWLFREQIAGDTMGTDAAFLKEIVFNLDIFNTQYQEILKKSKPLYESIKRRVIDLGLCMGDPKNPYLPSMQNLEKVLQDVDKVLAGIRLITTKDKQMVSNEKEPTGSNTDQELVSKIAEVWPMTPLNERECLNKAAEYYEKIYLKVSATDSLGQQLFFLNILLDLFIRIENFEKATEYLNSLYKFCSESRSQLYARRNSDPRAEAQIAKLADIMETLSDRRKEILEKKTEFFRTLFEKILEEHKGAEWSEMRTFLLNSNIPEDVVDNLHEDGDDDDEEEAEADENDKKKQKKKFLGLF